jgi:hypothetical protein
MGVCYNRRVRFRFSASTSAFGAGNRKGRYAKQQKRISKKTLTQHV